jgi:23S rRNA (cytosine1962-C5)-methyltransferase
LKKFGFFPENYELIDCGDGAKLERWGDVITIRPELQAYFKPKLTIAVWRDKAHWEFEPEAKQSINGTWKKLKQNAENAWMIEENGLYLHLEIKNNKHIGLFPEQAMNWKMIQERIHSESRFLNCFAYTGASSMVARQGGAEVTHCDSSKSAIDWAKTNAALNQFSTIKWLHEDALQFIQREVKRGNTYDCIQLDPPSFGISTNKAQWKLENQLEQLLSETHALLNSGGTLILNTYSPKVTIERTNQLRKQLNFKGESNELFLKSTTGKGLYFGIVSWFTKK